MVVKDKIELLRIAYPYIRNNLGGDNIFFVANKEIESEINDITDDDNAHFIDEDDIMEGLSLKSVREILIERGGNSDRAGWYLQQFLKMAYAKKSLNTYYLCFDADTIPLRRIKFFGNDGKPRFIVKKEYHRPYFQTIETLFGKRIYRSNLTRSYIAENMMFNSEYMERLISLIEKNKEVEGTLFFEKIMRAIDLRYLSESGFSEFETYGNYMDIIYPGVYNHIALQTERHGSNVLGPRPSDNQLLWASSDYDLISFEKHNETILPTIEVNEAVMRKYRAREVFDIVLTTGRWSRRLYRKFFYKRAYTRLHRISERYKK